MGRSDEWTEGAEGDTVAGSCQSRMSNEIFKTRRLFRKDTGASSAWQRDVQRGDNIPREQSQQESRPSWLACDRLSGAQGLVERGGGGADASCLRLCLQAAGAVEKQGSPASPP